MNGARWVNFVVLGIVVLAGLGTIAYIVILNWEEWTRVNICDCDIQRTLRPFGIHDEETNVGLALRRYQRLRAMKAPLDVGGGACGTEERKLTRGVGAILLRGEPHCTGTLLNQSWVLTAAHCIFQFDYKQMTFVLDPKDGVTNEGLNFASSKTPPYNRYKHNRLGVNDIALLKLDEPIVAGDLVFLELPDNTHEIDASANLEYLFVGFGVSAMGSLGAQRCVSMKIESACEETFCYAEPRQNTCHGDSGGPAIDSDTKTLVGVTVGGDQDCSAFGVSTMTGKRHRAWILNTISGN